MNPGGCGLSRQEVCCFQTARLTSHECDSDSDSFALLAVARDFLCGFPLSDCVCFCRVFLVVWVVICSMSV